MDEQTLLQQGIAAARAGQKAQARRLLRQALDLNPYSELAWLWLGGVAERDAERVACLQRVLAINPHNAKARQALARLQARAAAAPSQPSPALASRCPHCGAAIRAGARFCASCGQPLTAAAAPSPRPQPVSQHPSVMNAQSRPIPQIEKARKRGRGGLKLVTVAILGAVLLVACGIGGLLIYQALEEGLGFAASLPDEAKTAMPWCTQNYQFNCEIVSAQKASNPTWIFLVGGTKRYDEMWCVMYKNPNKDDLYPILLAREALQWRSFQSFLDEDAFRRVGCTNFQD